jgi:hypothetical protein
VPFLAQRLLHCLAQLAQQIDIVLNDPYVERR